MDSTENRRTESINAIANELYQALRSDGENFIFCPFTLQVVLAMTLEGADGKTANEIARTLHHSKNDKEILNDYKAKIQSLESPSLQIVTRLFVENTVEIKRDFRSLINEYFMCEIVGKDFIKRPEDSRLDINQWVEEATNMLITELLPPGSVSSDAKYVMVNAIHFYAHWMTRFDVENTVVMPFYVTPHRTVNVKMMVACKPFLFAECEKLDAKIIKLLYADEVFSFIIVLPNKVDGLQETENKLKSIDLSKELHHLHHHTVNLMLPRFTIETTIDLNDMLMRKMPTAFSDKANFSGITDGLLNVSKVIQKAFIEVNEEGTEATATTGIVITPRSRTLVHSMKCDHPFYFQIVKEGLVLFQGVLTKPDPEKRTKMLSHAINRSSEI